MPTRELSDLERDAADLHEALSELIRVYQFRDRKRICSYDVSVTQCHALRALLKQGAMTLNHLAAELYLDNSTTCRVVDSLERKRYTSRSQDPSDGRAIRVELTAEGRDLYGRIESDLLSEQKTLLAQFDPEVRQATARLIARLAREAAARFSRDDGRCC
ncbi:MAG: MarR family transcriptional regulator [Candidatus Krumholzibacteria bacterium]|nr:MarR family transcriptional regulator [Candidatus Krumholzibacteria bacterium]